MNRDERISRGAASPPAVTTYERVESISPRDIEGGTWIAASGKGIAFALLNWNDVEVLHPKARTRGSLIPVLTSSISAHYTQARLSRLDLQGILPFRLVGIFPDENTVREWRWDQNSLHCEHFSWCPRQWCSSSLSDARAALDRGAAFERAQSENNNDLRGRLRQLHASHDPGRGPFCTCVHRQDVQTLSYTEIICTPENVQCDYLAGSPCQAEENRHSISIRRLSARPHATNSRVRGSREKCFLAKV